MREYLDEMIQDSESFGKLSSRAQELVLKFVARNAGMLRGRSGKKSRADQVVDKLLHYTECLFTDQQGHAYVRWKKTEFNDREAYGLNFHKPVMAVNSKDFRAIVSRLGWDGGRLLRSSDSTAVVELFTALALTSGRQFDLHLRTAYDSTTKTLWYDLSDWRAVRLRPGSWDIIVYPPPLFKSYAFQKPQVEPIQIDPSQINPDTILRHFPIQGHDEKIMLLAYIVSAFLPHIPRPMIILAGPKGAGKTMTFRLLRAIIDPAEPECLDLSHRKEEIVQAAAHHYCLFIDNMSDLPNWLSDFLCRVCTGEGFSKRALYTDDADIVYSFKRLVGYNGINTPAFRSDLYDRALIFNLLPMTAEQRHPEEVIWQQFNADKPAILGTIFGILSVCLQYMQNAAAWVKPDHLPRMADFAIWGEAICQASGFEPNTFLSIYQHKLVGIHREIIQDNPLAQAVTSLLDQSNNGSICLTPTALLSELNRIARIKNINIRDGNWPASPGWLTRRLHELEIDFAATGISIVQKRNIRERLIEIGKRE